MNTPAKNRLMVANRKNIEGYLEQERMVRGWAVGNQPPEGIRFGELPQARDLTRPTGDVLDWVWRAE